MTTTNTPPIKFFSNSVSYYSGSVKYFIEKYISVNSDMEKDILIDIAHKYKFCVRIYVNFHTTNAFSSTIVEIFNFIRQLQTYDKFYDKRYRKELVIGYK